MAIGLRGDAAPEGLPASARQLRDPAELAGLSCDLVVEAANREAVLPWGRVALAHARAFAPASTSAFAEDGGLGDLLAIAERHGSKLLIAPGALGGVDALRAASALPLDVGRHTIVKPPAGWRGTAAETLVDLGALREPFVFFEGTAREAARRFPQNANVAAISAMAGIGLDRTRVALVADPGASLNAHRLEVEGAFGRFTITLENRPLAANPKTSELTVLSLLRLVENEAGRLVV